MISHIKKLKQSHWLLLLSLTYLIVRTINLTIIPVFVDEAIYTRWSEVILNDTNQFFIPLSDGKQPLFMWLGTFTLRFISDPLFATRLISVLSGLFSMLGVWLVLKELFNSRTAFFGAILYILTPFLMMYDRLAVPDNLLTTFFIYTTWIAVLLVRRMKLKYAIFLGLVLGGGLLTKSTAAIALFFIPFAFLLHKIDFKKVRNLQKLGLYAVVSLGIAFLLYRILKISPLYYLIRQRTGDFIFMPQEVLKHPLDPFLFRIPEVLGWLVAYLTWPIFGLVVIGLLLMLKAKWKAGIFLAAWLIGPLLIEMQIAKGFTPRYFIYVVPYAVMIGAFALSSLWTLKFMPALKVFLIIVLFLPAGWFEYNLLVNPENAPIPTKEKTGYLEDWSAGYGVKEISNYLKVQAQSGQAITVGTEGTQGYGTLPDGLEIYLRNQKNVSVVGMGQRADIYKVPTDLISDAKIHPAYLVVNKSRLLDSENPHLKLITSYPKANGQNPLLFFQII